METNGHRMPKLPFVAGFILEDLGLAVYRQGKHTREDTAQHMSLQSVQMKRLASLLSIKIMMLCSRAVESCGFFTILTLSHQLQDIDVKGPSDFRGILSIQTVKVRAVKRYSKCIFDVLTFSMEVSGTLRDMYQHSYACVCASTCACACVCTCSGQLSTLTMSDESMKNGIE